MTINAKEQRINLKSDPGECLPEWIHAFLGDRKAQSVTPGTLEFYHEKLMSFARFAGSHQVDRVVEITPNLIRGWLLWLAENGHNPGGCHAGYRSLRAFLYWWEDEIEPEGWKNPIRKVKAPKVAIGPLEPIDLDHLRLLLATCRLKTFMGDRDRAIMLTLIDTGVRARELISIDRSEVDLITGELTVKKGKGGKPRTVYLGRKTRRAVRAYLKHRQDDCPPLWIGTPEERLTYSGLRQIIRRRSLKAGVPQPTLHSFRRGYALTMLRNGVDVFTLQKLMGHADLQVLRRYLAQTTEDLRIAHAKASPADSMFT